MKSSYFIIVTVLFSVFFSCEKAPESHRVTVSKLTSNAYQPPVFSNDQRSKKIKGISAEIHQMMDEHAKSMNLPGVAYGIVVDEQLVLDSAVGWINVEKQIPASTRSAFRIASMTKSFTAMAILKLRDEGKLSLEDPVEKIIPEMADLEYLTSDSPKIDIQNLLTMTAGFPEDNPWGDRQLDEPDQMLMELVKEGISLSNPPSYSYEYSNTGYALLGKIISTVSGMPYQEYITENILRPLGMTHTYWEYEDVPDEQLAIGYRWEDENWVKEPMLHDGSYGAMGGLITTIEDFSKYVSFHLSAWPPRSAADKGPIKRSTLREMHTPQFQRLYAQARDWNEEICPVMAGYGYGLAVTDDCRGFKQIRHGGALPGFGSSYVFYPEYGVGVMAFCNLTYTSAMPTERIKKLLFNDLELQERELPISDILLTRQQQVVYLIQSWDPDLEKEILAENFYLDQSREERMSEIKDILNKAGELGEIGDMNPINQLRGYFEWNASADTIEIFFTLTPEPNPKIQYLDVSLKDESN
jgi:CubicO group peptidase (beta-lactamase class C family)